MRYGWNFQCRGNSGLLSCEYGAVWGGIGRYAVVWDGMEWYGAVWVVCVVWGR